MAKKKTLVIVESPAKAKKIGSFLGSDYVVEASLGHIRDLPQRAADIPADVKKEKWAKEGVNVDKDFEPLYVINPDKKKKVSELKALLKDADELYLATDEDREGEAIAWHLLEVLKPTVPVKRMVFHEITEPAIRAAAENPRDLDTDLVDAQETRRILDRLVGHFGTLQKLLSASIEDLQAVEGIGESRARSVREGLSRLAESSILERYV